MGSFPKPKLIGLKLLPLVQVVKAGGSSDAITKSGNTMSNICMARLTLSRECGTFDWASSSGTAYTSSLTICMHDSYIS